jgi:hydroxymethylglutaryl-CoA reductase
MTDHTRIIEGFSKLDRDAQLDLVLRTHNLDPAWKDRLAAFRHPDQAVQHAMEEFSENTVSNYHLPLGLAPNFLINSKLYTLPMLTEESSVVAAAANAAKYWAVKGGFRTRVVEMKKPGQVHFRWDGPPALLHERWPQLKHALQQAADPIQESMKKRGGGVLDIQLRDRTEVLDNYFQLDVTFDTVDSMGANFINTCLEAMAGALKEFFSADTALSTHQPPMVIMSILSNYTPHCVAEASVSAPVESLGDAAKGMDGELFAQKFQLAVEIARLEVNRAVTHNKGIMNGVDALVLATGNDFRAVEANVHAYAARDGQYRSLSHCSVENGEFTLGLRLPLALGTVGGLTSLHPLARFSMELMGKPGARELMQIAAAAGLASNFAAIRSLVTTGIQQGHMKMHLANILNAEGASDSEKQQILEYFSQRTVSVSEVRKKLEAIRK